jgi:hypothetical protein
VRQRVAVDLRAEARVRPQRLQLRAEQDRVAEAPPVEGLLAEAIAREREHAFATVPDGEAMPLARLSARVHQRAIASTRTSVSERL